MGLEKALRPDDEGSPRPAPRRSPQGSSPPSRHSPYPDRLGEIARELDPRRRSPAAGLRRLGRAIGDRRHLRHADARPIPSCRSNPARSRPSPHRPPPRSRLASPRRSPRCPPEPEPRRMRLQPDTASSTRARMAMRGVDHHQIAPASTSATGARTPASPTVRPPPPQPPPARPSRHAGSAPPAPDRLIVRSPVSRPPSSTTSSFSIRRLSIRLLASWNRPARATSPDSPPSSSRPPASRRRPRGFMSRLVTIPSTTPRSSTTGNPVIR